MSDFLINFVSSKKRNVMINLYYSPVLGTIITDKNNDKNVFVQ